MSFPAIFLDRDGVLTKEYGHRIRLDEVKLFPFVKESVKRIHQKNYLAIVVTNQSSVARGLFSEEDLVQLHEKIKKETGVDAIYYCPHHKDGSIPKYTFSCDCRKPQIGMIEKACKDFDINLGKSWVVGDRATDILLGKNVGIHTCLVETGYGTVGLEEPVEPEIIMEDLEAFSIWLK